MPCETCGGLKTIGQRVAGGFEGVPCPVCRPWPDHEKTMRERYNDLRPGCSYAEWVRSMGVK